MSYEGSTLNRSDMMKSSPALPNTSENYKVAQRVKEVSALKQLSVTETIPIAAGAAGTTGIVSLKYSCVYDNKYAYLATKTNTSLVLTSTALTTEVEMDMSSNMTDIIALLDNGEYVVDYESGVIGYKKASVDITMVATYFTRIKSTDTEMADLGGVYITPVNAAFDTMLITYVPSGAATGEIATVVYMLNAATVSTLTLSYNAVSGVLESAVRS